MSRFRVLTALAVALAVGACSDSQTPSAPSNGDESTTLQLDESAAAAAQEDAVGTDQTGGARLGTGGARQVGSEVRCCVLRAQPIP